MPNSRAMAFRQFRAVGTMDQWDVREDWDLPAECSVDLGLPRGVRQVVDAPDHVRHAHVVIVDNDGEIVRRAAVAA